MTRVQVHFLLPVLILVVIVDPGTDRHFREQEFDGALYDYIASNSMSDSENDALS